MRDFGKPSLADDLADVGIMLFGFGMVMIFTAAGLWFSDWMAGAFYRMGFEGSPVTWISHIVGFSLTVGAALTIGGRVLNGSFWWRT